MIIILILLAVIAVICGAVQTDTADVKADSSTLRFVHAIWRHGDRSPTSSWPNDAVNTEQSWPQGFGELTTLGMQQQYALGQYIRHRYDGFISQNYDKYQIYVQSTDFNRTIMSAMANLAGMYPPTQTQQWSTSIPWQPIPVHALGTEADPFNAACPKVQAVGTATAAQDPHIQKINRDNADLYAMLSEKTGLTVNDVSGISPVYDQIVCLSAHTDASTGGGVHRLPDWATQPVVAQLRYLVEQSSYVYSMTSAMQAGPAISDMIERMEKRRTMKDNEYRLRYYAYSAHDSTVIPTLSALNTDITQHVALYIPYAALVLLELHQTNDSQWIVKLLYRNSSTSSPLSIPISDCGHPCTLDNFRKRSEYLFVNRASACGHSNQVLSEHAPSIIAILLIIIVLLIVMLVVLLLMIKQQYPGTTARSSSIVNQYRRVGYRADHQVLKLTDSDSDEF